MLKLAQFRGKFKSIFKAFKSLKNFNQINFKNIPVKIYKNLFSLSIKHLKKIIKIFKKIKKN